MPPRVPKPLLVAPRPSMGPRASKPPADGKKEAAPAAVAWSSKACTGAAAKPKEPSWLCLLPMGGQTPREGLPQQLRMLPRLPHPPTNSVLSLGPCGGLMAVGFAGSVASDLEQLNIALKDIE